MGRALPGGKLPVALLTEVVGGAADGADEVRLGPALGEDAAAIDVEAGALVVATDPITLTGSEVGAYAVTINANDVAVMGVRPRWFLAAVLLPVGTTPDDVRALFGDLRAAVDRIGAVLVGGHAEVTGSVSQPVVVGQMLGHRADGAIVTSGGAGVDDVVLQIGAAPVEGAAVLAIEAVDRLGGLDGEVRRAAARAVDDPGISVVAPALAAAELGASAMHDPTEGGLASGLHELAAASGTGISLDEERIVWFEPGRAVCAAVGADPWATLASGCLLATFPPQEAEAAASALTRDGHRVARIGRMTATSGVIALRGGHPLPWPERDEVARLLG